MTDPGQARQPKARQVLAARRQGEQPAAGRSTRGQRLRLAVLTIASAMTLVVAGGSWVLASYVSGSLGRVNAGTTGTPQSGPINILVAGIDTRSGLTRQEEIRLHVGNDISTNADTLMLVHISADHSSVHVVSLPRDSWVNIPGHGMSKINAAIGLGGPALMVKTVEQATGLVINDYVEIDFLGFVKVIDALGGVDICLPYAVDDSYTGLHLPAGVHHVDGVTALAFARDRHSFALSDVARISDQQQLLSSLFAEATDSGILANPFRLQSFLSSLTASISVDKGFDLIRLADELRGLRSQDVTFTTVPLATLDYVVPSTGEEAVLWNAKAAAALFASLKYDTADRAAKSARTVRSARLTRSRVSVDIYNGTWTSGLSASTGKQLAALGFRVHKDGLNWAQHTVSQTLIQYPPGQLAAATLLQKVVPGAAVASVRGLARIRLILGASGSTVTNPASPPLPSAAGNVADTGQSHTASEDACR